MAPGAVPAVGPSELRPRPRSVLPGRGRELPRLRPAPFRRARPVPAAAENAYRPTRQEDGVAVEPAIRSVAMQHDGRPSGTRPATTDPSLPAAPQGPAHGAASSPWGADPLLFGCAI